MSSINNGLGRALAVSSNPHIAVWLREWVEKHRARVDVAANAVDALRLYKEFSPSLIIIDNELPDMNGMSLASIIKDGEDGDKVTLILYNMKRILGGAKADVYLPKTTTEAELMDALKAQVVSYFDARYLKAMHSEELHRAKLRQYSLLPSVIQTKQFRVSNVYSPMNELSGDGLDYWIGEDSRGLYGFLFDCTGHDFVSFAQGGSVRGILKKTLRLYQYSQDGKKGLGVENCSTLASAMKEFNEFLFLVDKNPEPVSVILFHLNFAQGIFRFCSAGIPAILYRRTGETRHLPLRANNYLIGYEEGVNFTEQELSLTGIDEVIVSSDGFYELVFKGEAEAALSDTIAKHDDVSAIMIELTREGRR